MNNRNHAQDLADIALDERSDPNMHAVVRNDARIRGRLRGYVDRRLPATLAALTMRCDVFRNDDRVIHENADRDQQSDHRQHVDRVVDEEHDGKTTGERHRSPIATQNE